MTETRVESWTKYDDEPIGWYSRFVEFYLPNFLDAGSLNTAYLNFLKAQKERGDSNAQKKLTNGNAIAPKDWVSNANKWKWRERAEAFKAEQAKRLLATEKEILFDIVKRRLELAKQTLERQEVLANHFKCNYGDRNYLYEKTQDGLNIAKLDSVLTESNEKALNHYVELLGLKEVLQEKLNEQQNEI